MGKKRAHDAVAACLHSETKDEIMTDPDSGQDFGRRTCANPDCGKWIRDLPPIDLGAIRDQAIRRIFQSGEPPA